LVAICGGLIALLFQQVDMKVPLAAAEVHLSKIEKIAQEQIAKEQKMPDASPRHLPITLDNDDAKAIRAFIKVLPSKPGAQQIFMSVKKFRITDRRLCLNHSLTRGQNCAEQNF
jgi:hypothetical protein